jgi:hypothetical protein
MNSRQRIQEAFQHRETDRVPLDLGGTPVTGMHVSSVYLLRQALGLDTPGTPVKVVNIYQMLGEIKPDLADALGVDTVFLANPVNSFGIKNEGWKPWETMDGTPVLVPEGFNTELDSNGDLLVYPQGDRSVPPAGRMPQGGYYFDVIIRQLPIVEENLSVEDNLEEFSLLSEEVLAYYQMESERLFETTDKAILVNIGGTGFGDIALVPGPQLKHPKGIRDIEEWYVSILSRQDYVLQIFERQCGIALENLERFYKAVGDRVAVIFLSGTDFGSQHSLLISPRLYRGLYKPFHQQLNDWIHTHTHWKTFIHTDGSVLPLIPDFIAAGFDILNPIQYTADNMGLQEIKQRFGSHLTFWGGGIDTQRVLPFGTPEEVRQEVCRNIEILKARGGFVFGSVHNVQPGVPVENLIALYDAFRKYSSFG